jgi:acyl carrier protein
MHVSSCQENGQHRRFYRRKGSQVANISAAPVEVRPDPEELETAILEALAEVRAAPVAELREEMAAAGGDLEIDSREAEAVIAILENRYGRTLAAAEDLEPERLASVGSLGELIQEHWAVGRPVTVRRSG